MAGDRAHHEGKKPPSGKSKSKSRSGPTEPRAHHTSSAAGSSRAREGKRQKFQHDRTGRSFLQDWDANSRDIVSTMSCHVGYQGSSSPWRGKAESKKPLRPDGGSRSGRPGKNEQPQRTHRFAVDWPPDFATSNAARKQKKVLDAPPRPKKNDTSNGVQTA